MAPGTLLNVGVQNACMDTYANMYSFTSQAKFEIKKLMIQLFSVVVLDGDGASQKPPLLGIWELWSESNQAS